MRSTSARSATPRLPPMSGTGGSGPPVLFLHGWGVGPNAYAEPLRQLVGLGCSVAAPTQPGFGRQPAPGASKCSFAGYARWAMAYLDAVGIDDPVMVVGHSFGGGVAVQLAHDYPERVRGVVLCNAVGGMSGPATPGTGAFVDRPLWEWGRHLGADLLAFPAATRVLPAVLGAVVPNIVQHPMAQWRVGNFVRRADLVGELGEVARRGVPVTVVWSDRDRLVPHASFKALCTSAGVEGIVVPGHHSWLIADPGRFAEIVLRALVDAGVVEDTLACASHLGETAGVA